MFVHLLTTVAASLLEQKFIEVKGKQLFFSNVPSEALLPPPAEGRSISVDEEKPEEDNADVEDIDDTSIAGDNTEAEALARTVCIQNVPSNMVEFLEVILTQEKSGGGSIEQLIEDGDNVMVTFEDSDGMSPISFVVLEAALSAAYVHVDSSYYKVS